MPVRRLFAGSNSAKGFHSFFHHIIGEDARRVYLLKGGPGTGKSRLMKDLAERLAAEGLSVELFFCSSDAHSLDAFACGELGVAVMDATFPHVQEPAWPGCRDEFLNLGEFWDGEKLAQKREEIAAAGRKKGVHFQAAYRYFAAALAVEENVAARSSGNKLDVSSALEEILGPIRRAGKAALTPQKTRRLFASALTPQGYVSEIGALSAGFTRYIFTGPPGAGQFHYLELILSQAELAGLQVEAFHYPLDPGKLLHLLLPELNLAVLTATALEPLEDLAGRRLICGRGGEGGANARDRQLFRELVDLGIAELQKAQAVHAGVESIYAAAMDFSGVDALRERLEEEILSYKNRS